MFPLVDSHGRSFKYLRLSVTDRCNFSCEYCLPNGYQLPKGAVESELSVSEIRRLVAAFSRLGFSKIRLTGGEPTIRRDILDIAKTISRIPGIRKIAMTTNGARLTEMAMPLRSAGISAINISVDSLEKNIFNKTTGTDRYDDVMAGIEKAMQVGFETIKINAVLLRDTHEAEIQSFINWIQKRPISVRFIELMKTGKNKDYFSKKHISGGAIQLFLLKAGWTQMVRSAMDGPAVVYGHPNSLGTIGIIAPYSGGFCETCNRLRVSSRGNLRLCLFGEGEIPLRDYLQDDYSEDALIVRIQKAIKVKPIAHELAEGKYGITQNFASIGG